MYYNKIQNLKCCPIINFYYFDALLIVMCTFFNNFSKLGLDLVPRQGAEMVNPDSMSIIELYHVHVLSAENSQGASVSRFFSQNKIYSKVPNYAWVWRVSYSVLVICGVLL